jgi:hypothetical protein
VGTATAAGACGFTGRWNAGLGMLIVNCHASFKNHLHNLLEAIRRSLMPSFCNQTIKED